MDRATSTLTRTWIVWFLILWVSLLYVGRDRMLRDPGTFWHTVVGQRMLESGRPVRTDPFSFSQADQPWIAQQWLGECAMAAIHRISGLDGLLTAAATLLAATFSFLAFRLRRTGLPWLPTAVVLMLAIGASSYHFLARPHIVTIAFMAFVFALLCDVESRRAAPRKLLWLPPILLVWTNVHGGALGGLATLLIVMLAWLVWPSLQRSPHKTACAHIPRLFIGVVASLSIVAILVNPYGPSLPRVWMSLMDSPVLPRLIIEHAPLRLTSIEGAMTLALAAVYLTALARARHTGFKVTWLIPLIWLVLAFGRVRHGPLFAVTTVVALADMLPALAGQRPSAAGPRSSLSILTIPVVCVGLAFTLQATGIRCPIIGAGCSRLDPSYWPVEATHALISETRIPKLPTAPRVFNDMRFGGFLIYSAPQVRVYIDDRCELYRDQGLLRYVEIQKDPRLIEGLAAYEGVNLAMVRTGSALERYLSTSPNWSRLHTDPTASLYGRRDRQAAEWRTFGHSARSTSPSSRVARSGGVS